MRDFRSDINGLRAWAVVPVILYHFGVTGFSGGFVGVDIFFVISGFLMTGLIVRHLQNGSSHVSLGAFGAFLLQFWLARARRIIPSLLVLCTVLMVLGWFWLPSLDYERLSSHTIPALLFVSNIKFWREAGYFDIASHEKWLLHTWSLSVEWQFYILLPIILMSFWRFFPSRKMLVWLMAAGMLASFALCVFLTAWKPSAAFYLLPGRAWEMLAGGLVFMLNGNLDLNSLQRRLLEAVGLILIAVAILAFDEQTLWPGFHALVPAAGAVFVLIAARNDSFWTGNRLAQLIGDSSYSLYLWHWPVSVLLLYLGNSADLKAILASLVATACLGWISYKLVETPARKSFAALKPVPAISVIIGAFAIVGGASASVWEKGGIPGRMPESIERMAAGAKDKNPRRDECMGDPSAPPKECTYGGPKLGVVVLGDSHAASMVRSVEKALPSGHLHVLDWTSSACPTIENLKDSNALHGDICGAFVHSAIDRLEKEEQQVPLLVVNRMNVVFEQALDFGNFKPRMYLDTLPATFNDNYRRQMRDGALATLCKLAAHRPVFVLRSTPEMQQSVPEAMSHSASFYGESGRVTLPVKEYRERSKWAHELQDMAATQCGVKILDPTPYFCDKNLCYGDKDGVPLYFDDDHLSEHGAQMLIPLFMQMFAGGEAQRHYLDGDIKALVAEQ
ncbi:acyltransferase family protein [Rhizobium sp. LjRoot30]|uniref:acyltransferase family protein n=1 Tax=Rhizobium sp. LjRoot30 TaxID=3342320 RepID=UPI003ECC709D